jgi:hypothetical protein
MVPAAIGVRPPSIGSVGRTAAAEPLAGAHLAMGPADRLGPELELVPARTAEKPQEGLAEVFGVLIPLKGLSALLGPSAGFPERIRQRVRRTIARGPDWRPSFRNSRSWPSSERRTPEECEQALASMIPNRRSPECRSSTAVEAPEPSRGDVAPPACSSGNQARPTPAAQR